jgi:ribosomal-protein-alanine N-acetyltransferase
MEKILLETDRLLIRPFTIEDAEDALDFCSNPKTIKNTGDVVRTTVAEIENIINNIWLSDYANYGYGRYAVFYKPNNKLIGFCGFKYLPELKMTDLGYRFLPEYWGKGIATESSKKVLEFGFSTLNIKTVFGTVVPENVASSAILRKLGFKYREMKPYPGDKELGDLEWYYLSEEEYNT